MNKETKIVLAKNGEKALYLFKREFEDFTVTEFVVGYIVGDTPVIGSYVNGWANGHYFRNLEDALEYLKKN